MTKDAIQTTASTGVEERLDVLIRLTAALLTKGSSKKDAILTLAALKLTPKGIAEILGATGNQVSVTIYGSRKAASRGRAKKQSKS
jgi:hypothetical protein